MASSSPLSRIAEDMPTGTATNPYGTTKLMIEQILTDACKAFVLRGKKVALVRGDVSNIKITYPQDLRVAEAMLEA